MTPRVSFNAGKAALLMLNEPSKSMSITVLKALKLRSEAEQRKFPGVRVRRDDRAVALLLLLADESACIDFFLFFVDEGPTCSAIHNNVHCLELRRHTRNNIFARCSAANITRHVRGVPPAASYGCSSLSHNIFSPPDQDNVGAQRRQSFGDAESDAAAAAWCTALRKLTAQGCCA